MSGMQIQGQEQTSEGSKGLLLGASRGTSSAHTVILSPGRPAGTSDLQTVRCQICVVLSHSVCGDLFQQPQTLIQRPLLVRSVAQPGVLLLSPPTGKRLIT